MESIKIFNDALRNTATLGLDTDESSKKSLFGFLVNLADAARALDGGGAEFIAEGQGKALFETMLKFPDGKRYMGLKTTDLHEIIRALFADSHGKLFGNFGKYTYDDLLLYIEYCKRIFITGYLPAKKTNTANAASSNSSRKWTKEELAQLLFDEDREAAKYVIENQSTFELMEIAFAKSILRKGG
jgi:hypothetical protein